MPESIDKFRNILIIYSLKSMCTLKNKPVTPKISQKNKTINWTVPIIAFGKQFYLIVLELVYIVQLFELKINLFFSAKIPAIMKIIMTKIRKISLTYQEPVIFFKVPVKIGPMAARR